LSRAGGAASFRALHSGARVRQKLGAQSGLARKKAGDDRPLNPNTELERPILAPDMAPGRGSTARAGKKRPCGPQREKKGNWEKILPARFSLAFVGMIAQHTPQIALSPGYI
jgi:hypothetical protein